MATCKIKIKMSVGKLSEFNLENGNWLSYCEKLEMYFVANEIKIELKLPTLISVIRYVNTYEVMANLFSTKKPSEFKYSEVVVIMQRH